MKLTVGSNYKDGFSNVVQKISFWIERTIVEDLRLEKRMISLPKLFLVCHFMTYHVLENKFIFFPPANHMTNFLIFGQAVAIMLKIIFHINSYQKWQSFSQTL